MHPLEHLVTAEKMDAARARMPDALVRETPLIPHQRLSREYGANIVIKDETEQNVRSYKCRAPAYAIQNLIDEARARGIVCASAGNHAQGVAAACHHFGTHGIIFMPKTTHGQKVSATKRHGGDNVDIILTGDNFDEAFTAAKAESKNGKRTFIHPFNDPDTIIGQGTVAVEIMQQMRDACSGIDIILVPVGGGGLVAGISTYVKQKSPNTKVIGVEPAEAAAMKASLEHGSPVTLENISTFVDGAAVKRPGDLTFSIVHSNDVPIQTVPENRLCSTLMDLHSLDGKVCEPAGALSIDALKDMREGIRGKTVVCILSGSNFDLSRYADVTERSRIFEQQKRYLTIHVPSRPGAFMEFLRSVSSRSINVSYLHYNQVTNGDTQAVTIGLESESPESISQLVTELKTGHIRFEDISGDPHLREILK